jgi:UDP-N-acetylglucosamine diphosphorylase / glucose-1-phosphate thymidylyltransferase / UDP-N-acetylgalactosamine diphosphorylase / glucosamine-1-phosphate N-acetyltransferase / galactosamine-1-phosphate N-acetyltransferase
MEKRMEKVSTAIILSAGKSTRSYPITLEKPKALLKILNKPVLERTLDELVGIVEEVIVIVGYKKEMIMSAIGSEYKGLKIKYVEQQEQNGTGGAILQVKDQLKGRFLVINGDDLYKKGDIERMLNYEYSVLAQQVANPSVFGVFTIGKNEFLNGIVEKPQTFVSNLANVGCYLLDTKIFEHDLQKSTRGEYEITDYLLYLIQNQEIHVERVQEYWLALGYSWDLLKANMFVLKNDFQEATIGTKLEDNTKIYEQVRIGKDCKFGKNIEIVGPAVIGNNVTIKDNCYILPYSVIENDVVIEADSIIAESLIMDEAKVQKNSKTRGAIVTPKYTIVMNEVPKK